MASISSGRCIFRTIVADFQPTNCIIISTSTGVSSRQRLAYRPLLSHSEGVHPTYTWFIVYYCLSSSCARGRRARRQWTVICDGATNLKFDEGYVRWGGHIFVTMLVFSRSEPLRRGDALTLILRFFWPFGFFRDIHRHTASIVCYAAPTKYFQVHV